MTKSRKPKPFLCFDCQIKKLVDRGLVDNENNLKDHLRNENYYRFSGYLLNFKSLDSNGFETYNGLLVSEVYKLQEAELALRMLFMEIISHVETSLRTYIAYTFADLYGSLGYFYKENFEKNHLQESLISTIDMRKTQNDAMRFIRHHKLHFEGQLPIWIVVELMTFEDLIKYLYNNLHKEAKDKIQNDFVDISPKRLKKWLIQIKNLRNECAHHFRIFDSKREKILIPDKIRSFILVGSNWEASASTLFGYLCVMKYIINNEVLWNTCLTRIRDFILDYSDVIPLPTLGFPDNWEDILDSVIL